MYGLCTLLADFILRKFDLDDRLYCIYTRIAIDMCKQSDNCPRSTCNFYETCCINYNKCLNFISTCVLDIDFCSDYYVWSTRILSNRSWSQVLLYCVGSTCGRYLLARRRLSPSNDLLDTRRARPSWLGDQLQGLGKRDRSDGAIWATYNGCGLPEHIPLHCSEWHGTSQANCQVAVASF